MNERKNDCIQNTFDELEVGLEASGSDGVSRVEDNDESGFGADDQRRRRLRSAKTEFGTRIRTRNLTIINERERERDR